MNKFILHFKKYYFNNYLMFFLIRYVKIVIIQIYGVNNSELILDLY